MWPFSQHGRSVKLIRMQLRSIHSRLDGLESTLSADQPSTATDPRFDQLEQLTTAGFEGLTDRIEDVEGSLKDTILAVDEGISRVDRAERRIKATVTRARKELAALGYEDPGLEAEAHELRAVDGAGGDQGGLQPVSEEVEGAADEASSVPGVSAAQLRHVRGF